MNIAMIGTRDLSQFLVQGHVPVYKAVAETIARQGHTLLTGAAQGADQLAAEIALRAGGKVCLFLPWVNYERQWWQTKKREYPDQVFFIVYDPNRDTEWKHSVKIYHPAPDKLSDGSRALHARNYGLAYHAQEIVALPGIKKVGGTGQGVRIGRQLGRKVFDLTRPDDLTRAVIRFQLQDLLAAAPEEEVASQP